MVKKLVVGIICFILVAGVSFAQIVYASPIHGGGG